MTSNDWFTQTLVSWAVDVESNGTNNKKVYLSNKNTYYDHYFVDRKFCLKSLSLFSHLKRKSFVKVERQLHLF